jgi:hypothetical protein
MHGRPAGRWASSFSSEFLWCAETTFLRCSQLSYHIVPLCHLTAGAEGCAVSPRRSNTNYVSRNSSSGVDHCATLSGLRSDWLVTKASATVDVRDGVYLRPLCEVVHDSQEVSVPDLALREVPSISVAIFPNGATKFWCIRSRILVQVPRHLGQVSQC